MTHKAEIFKAFKDHGPMTEAQVREALPNIKTKSIKARLWEMRSQGFLALGEDSVYQITSAHDPDGPELDAIGRRQLGANGTNGHNRGDWDGEPEALTGDEEKFRELLKDCSVNRGIDPIVEMFFSGDPESLDNLVQVLEDARAYVAPLQKRMIVRYWARYIRHWPLTDTLEERLGQDGGRGGSFSDPKNPGSEFMEDLGWKVEKDKDGEWIPRPSGDLTYSNALKWCATMNASRPMTDRDDDPEEDTTARGRKRGAQQDPILGKLLDRAFPDKDEKDGRIEALERRLEESDRQRQDDRMERMEAMIAGMANQNPIQQFLEVQTQLQTAGLLGGGQQQQHVTDNSPTVQLVKDQSDKMDKNMNRVVGLLERVMLRGHDQLTPEATTTTPQQDDARAKGLLDKMEQGTRSKTLRNQLWGKGNA